MQSEGNNLLMEDETILLYEADFPNYYVDKHHPDDYKIVREPFVRLIYHDRIGHNKLLLRITTKIGDGMYLPATYVCITDACKGACVGIYTNALLDRLINNRIVMDKESGISYINTSVGKINVAPTPAPHQDCNIIGLRALCKFGLTLSPDSFEFTNLPDYF